ncbi:hypothetical protein PsorP6_006351 [Peronosclerospora sorghi]|uniref:Uncharacterized protein n=1 Tax=Peronosclerospora sorghi TaxID=230839 RepID=A0ACC0W4X0_9STRA|nr:hypothetical protein PsorP6_006351 [Peronosclerospora sorghi]
MSGFTSHPLGVSLPPHDPHAISVSMPTWSDVVGYEEGHPDVLTALACGYPRFFRHPLVLELEHVLHAQLFPTDDDDATTWDEMVAPTRDVAERLRHFLLDTHVKCDPDHVSVHEVHGLVQLVRFPRSMRPSAKAFWQHSGEIVTSRHAQALLHVLAQTQPQDHVKSSRLRLGKTDKHVALRQRIAELYVDSGAIDQVAVYPTGMSAIFSTVRLLQRFRGTACKSILVGFPYVDTLKILSRPAWCPRGVHFFPLCGEDVMQQVEAIVASEKVLGIWTEFPSNPLLSLPDLKRLAKCAHENGTVLIVDDTVGSYNVNPMAHGCADLVVTSLSKIFSGSGNVMAGSVVLNPSSPRAKELETLFHPDKDSYLVEPDVDALLEQSANLAERLAKTNATTAELVHRLVAHPVVKKVYYPTQGNVKNLYDPFANVCAATNKVAGYGPLLSILLHGGLEPTRAFYNALTIAKGPSLGTNFTIACPYTLLAHYQELAFAASCDVDRNLIRISIGQEDPDVIWADFEHALGVAAQCIQSTSEST